MSPHSVEIFKPSLRELGLGDYSLPVPFDDNAFQVNRVVGEGVTLEPLAVVLEEDAIRLKREADGQDFQIDYNLRPFGTLKQRAPIKIFTDPIHELVIERPVVSKDSYRIDCEELTPINLQWFNIFLSFVLVKTYAMQNPTATAADILAVFDEYPDLAPPPIRF